MGKHYRTLPPDLVKMQEDILDGKRNLMMLIDSATMVRGVDIKKIKELQTDVDQGVEEIIFALKDPYK